MKDFTRMKSYTKNNIKYFDFTNTKMFDQEFHLSNTSIRKAFAFSYEMAPRFHREYRTGGKHIRKPNEIFVNTFTGKLSEFYVYNVSRKDK